MSEQFTIDGNPHNVGDKECAECWRDDYPLECSNCGKGLKHSEFYDESYDSVFCLYKCDVCGDTDDED